MTNPISQTCNFLNVTGASIGTYCGNPGVVVDGKKIRCEQCRDRRWPEETYTCTRVITRGVNKGLPCGKNTKFSDSLCSVCRKIKASKAVSRVEQVDNVEQKRKVENDDDNETVNTEYKFRAETMADVESLYNILEFRNAVSHMQITKDECFPDVEVTFTSTLSIDEILGMMKNIDDSHVMTGSLDVAEEYTGDRFRDTPIIRSLVTWKLAPIPKEWIVKNNWVKQIVHTPFSVPKVVERPTILTKALDQQTSPKPCCFTYDECLPTCNTQSTSTSTPIFDEIVYDVGVNWCWFYVRCGQVIASFRLHLEDEMCWKFFKLVESPRLFPSVASGTTFKYGSTTRRHVAITKNTVDAPLDFLWLQNFLKTIEVEFRGAIEEEEFVDLYKIDENRLDMQEDLDRLNSLRRQLVLGEC